MSTKYKNSHEVSDDTLADRLDEFADAVVARMRGDPRPFDREFICSIPAEHDHDADLVLSEAARRLRATAKGKYEHQA